MVAALIAIVPFLDPASRDGTKISWLFGPIMILWFIALGTSGFISLWSMPDIARAANPGYAFQFFQQNGFAAFIVLSEVVLCADGIGGAFRGYGASGPLGRSIRAWCLVFVALVINYLGQGRV